MQIITNQPNKWSYVIGPYNSPVAVVKPGHMIFEMEGVPQDVAREALRLASHKLSIATQIRERSETPYAS